MEVSYRRRFHQSYMILEDSQEPEELCELTMLAHNKIPGLLAMETEIADGKVRYWYDITGKQSLADYLVRREADGRLLELLFQGLDAVCQKLSEHLLEESRLVLEPEYLYLDFSGKKLGMVYFPGYHKDIRDSFRELMEVLLRRLSHSDKQGAAMAYEMYQLSLQAEQSFADMLRRAIAAGQTEPEGVEEHTAQRSSAGAVGEYAAQRSSAGAAGEYAAQRNSAGAAGEYAAQRADAEEEYQGHYAERTETVRNHVERVARNMWENPVKKEGKHRKQSGSVMVHSPAPAQKESGHFAKIKAYFAGMELKSGRKDVWRSRWRTEEAELPYVTAEEETITYKTELLYGGSERQGILRYLGNGGQQDFVIEKDSFLLGKEAGEVDGCITGKSVSRIHARISREDGNYYLEDMNSTNGTYLNGEQLEYRQKQELAARDRITFGMEEYIFM